MWRAGRHWLEIWSTIVGPVAVDDHINGVRVENTRNIVELLCAELELRAELELCAVDGVIWWWCPIRQFSDNTISCDTDKYNRRTTFTVNY